MPTTKPHNRIDLPLSLFYIDGFRINYEILALHGAGIVRDYRVYRVDRGELTIVRGDTIITLGNNRLLFRIVIGDDRISVLNNTNNDGVMVETYGLKFADMVSWEPNYLGEYLMRYYNEFMDALIPAVLCSCTLTQPKN